MPTGAEEHEAGIQAKAPPSVRRAVLAYAAVVLAAACSVFPNEAVLPATTGGGGSLHDGGGGSASSGDAGGSRDGGARDGDPHQNAGAGLGDGDGPARDAGQASSDGGVGGDHRPRADGNVGGDSVAGTSTADGSADGADGAEGAEGAEGGRAEGGLGIGGSMNEAGWNDAGTDASAVGECAVPIVHTLVSTNDSFISERDGDTKTNFGGEPRLWVSGENGARNRALLMFDLAPISNGQTVLRATLRLTLMQPVIHGRSLFVFPLLSQWEEANVSWSRATQRDKWTSEGADTASNAVANLLVSDDLASDAVIALELRDTVRELVAGVRPNWGWLVDTGALETPLSFASRESSQAEARPRLVVETCP